MPNPNRIYTISLTSAYPCYVALAESASQAVAKLPAHELWLVFVRDPDGNLVGLMEERR